MGFIGKILGKPQSQKQESGNEQYERATGAKNSADTAYEKATGATQTGTTPTQAGNTIHRWGDRISSGANTLSSKVKSPAFQTFAKNAVYSGNNVFGDDKFNSNNDLVGLGNKPHSKPRKSNSKKKKRGNKGFKPRDFDPW